MRLLVWRRPQPQPGLEVRGVVAWWAGQQERRVGRLGACPAAVGCADGADLSPGASLVSLSRLPSWWVSLLVRCRGLGPRGAGQACVVSGAVLRLCVRVGVLLVLTPARGLGVRPTVSIAIQGLCSGRR
jgi:hypothetical protein